MKISKLDELWLIQNVSALSSKKLSPHSNTLHSAKFQYFFTLYEKLRDWHCVTLHDYAWLCMTMYDCVWLCMTMYDCVWLYMTMFDYVWLYMTMNDCVWQSMNLYASLMTMPLYHSIFLWIPLHDYWLCIILFDPIWH